MALLIPPISTADLSSHFFPGGGGGTAGTGEGRLGGAGTIQFNGATNLSNVVYNSAHAPTSLSYGTNIAQATYGYNARLQLGSLAYTYTGGQFSVTYNYGTGNNGQIQSITDNVDSTRSTTYTYDAWARLKTAQNAQWGLSWDYDRYGNRKAQNQTLDAPPYNQVTMDPVTNRITDPGYAYDAAGNMTNDGQNTLVYEGENRVVTNTKQGTVTNYTYDGNGLRVKKQVTGGVTTVYIFSGTKVIAEYENGAAVGSPTREYIYSGSQLMATVGGGVTKYHLRDHLSVRVTTDGTTAVGQGHYPYGEQWYPAPPTGPATKWQFTSYERDGGTGESGNDYATARTYINRLGRFSSPDPIAGSIADPQSLNRYAYVRNDPSNLVDPTGLLDSPFWAWFMNPANQMRGISSRNYGMFIMDALGYPRAGDDPAGNNSDYLAAEEGAYNKRVEAAWLKKQLGDLFEKNRECADLLGGKDRASLLLSKMRLQDVTEPGWKMPAGLTDRQRAAVNRVRINWKWAAVTFTFDLKSGQWDKTPFNVYVGQAFLEAPLPAQLTVAIHELLHVALNTGKESDIPSNEEIGRICGTAQ